MRKLFILALMSFGAASAQSISFGALGGAPFTDAVRNASGSNYVVGPAFQVNLPLGLRVEADALYRPVNFPGIIQNYSASQWQFPFLLQYRFKTPVIKPFAEAGVSFDHLASISAAANTLNVHQNGASLVLGGGVDVKIPFIRLSGELRYSREGTAEFPGISNLNQAEVLVGVHF